MVLCLGLASAQAQEDDSLDSSDYLLPETKMQLRQKPLPLPDLTERAESGEVWAQNRLGERYLQGIEAPQHFGKARQWFTRAAQQGYGPAMLELAELFAHGKGGPQDLENAYLWYSLAAANGIKSAIIRRERLSDRLDSKTVEKMQDKAVEWRPKPERPAKP